MTDYIRKIEMDQVLRYGHDEIPERIEWDIVKRVAPHLPFGEQVRWMSFRWLHLNGQSKDVCAVVFRSLFRFVNGQIEIIPSQIPDTAILRTVLPMIYDMLVTELKCDSSVVIDPCPDLATIAQLLHHTVQYAKKTGKAIPDEVSIESATGLIVFGKRTPKTYLAVCPLHVKTDDPVSAKRSFAWCPETGVLHCFFCGKGGLIQYLKERHG